MQKSVKPKIYDAYSGTLFFIYKEKKKKSSKWEKVHKAGII